MTRQPITNDTSAGAPDADALVVATGAQKPGMVTVREDVLASAGAAIGFVAGAGGIGAAAGMPLRALGLGRRTPALKGMRMRNSKRNAQLAPAMYSLAATNAQLLGLVGRRHPMMALARLGVVAAGVAYVTADEAGRKAMLDQATGLLEQGGNLLTSSGLLDKVFNK
ncbi:MAG: hypothetical protein AVDCRST_MAG67-3434 [uncultured Solirubrobacteraceae bacterium]|uniref:Uncharacterized protein n=1 Tax=uncultured Solirubrobacteraceae bacterium TaxID=1162706 RepID=A0A6J4TFK6_9ACTN|nr:MAG: hypothetical protein AVDCRST_MAG67-3434 [uncultured Solirubrobacteraceae bacterium]